MKKLIALACLALSAFPAQASGTLFQKQRLVMPHEAALLTPPPADPGILEAALVAEVMQAANAERMRAGLAPLGRDAALDAAAARYSRKMRDFDFFSHVAPDGETLDGRLDRVAMAHYDRLGENLWSAQGAIDWRAERLAREAAANWIESPSHRDNLLESAYTLGGVGAAIRGQRIWITMLYARTASADGLSAPAPVPADLTGFTQALGAATVRRIDAERAGSGLGPYRRDPILDFVARTHAQTMLANGTLGTAGSDGRSVLERAMRRSPGLRRLAVGLWRGRGGLDWQAETMAERTVETWRGRSESLADMLDPRFGLVGIGSATDGERVLTTILYGEEHGAGF